MTVPLLRAWLTAAGVPRHQQRLPSSRQLTWINAALVLRNCHPRSDNNQLFGTDAFNGCTLEFWKDRMCRRST
jgi:hypothetical protein